MKTPEQDMDEMYGRRINRPLKELEIARLLEKYRQLKLEFDNKFFFSNFLQVFVEGSALTICNGLGNL